MFRADDVIELLPGLAGERPVFHSEATSSRRSRWRSTWRIPAFVCGWRPAGEGHAPRSTCH